MGESMRIGFRADLFSFAFLIIAASAAANSTATQTHAKAHAIQFDLPAQALSDPDMLKKNAGEHRLDQTATPTTAKSGDPNESDFQKIFNVENFDYLCGSMLNECRDVFLEKKQAAHFRSLDEPPIILGQRGEILPGSALGRRPA